METAVTGKPLISIVMSVKNGMPFLVETVDSILKQTFQEWELIAVDNASADGSADYLKEIAAKDVRIRTFFNATDQGMSGGLNRGIQEAKADWIARMDADDVMFPERLEKQWLFLTQNPDVKITSCRAVYIDEHGRAQGKTVAAITSREIFDKTVKANEAIGLLHPGVMMEKQAVLEMGGYRGQFWPAEDIDLWNRLAEKGYLILIQDEVLMAYRIHTQSNITKRFHESRLKYQWARECMWARRRGELEPDWETFMRNWNAVSAWEKLNRWRKHLAKFHYRQAGQMRMARHWLKAIIHLFEACILQPEYTLPRLWEQFACGKKMYNNTDLCH